MEVLHAVLLSEFFSAKVVSITDIFLLGFFALGTLKVVRALSNSIRLLERGKTNSWFAHDSKELEENAAKTQANTLANTQAAAPEALSKIADTIAHTVESMSRSQYVMKDRAIYSSVYQTPVRDSLRALRSVSNELRQQALGTTSYSGQSQNRSGSRICSEQVISGTFPALKNYAHKNGISLQLVENAHGFVDLAVGCLEKILRELVLNAITHNHAGTHIQLACSFTAEQAVFEVTDTGKGISAKVVNDALQISNSSEARNRRLTDAETQLNLSTISHIAKLSGGRLEVKSALTWGTQVRLLLPAALICRKPPHTKYIKAKQYTINDSKNRKKILVISKTRISQCATIQNLSEQYALHVCSSFNQAMSTLFSVKPDVIVADFSWQQSLSIQFCKFVRSCVGIHQIPFVSLTMPLEQDAKVNMYSSGVSAILEKPLAERELAIVVRNLIDSHASNCSEICEPQASYSFSQMIASSEQNVNNNAFKERLIELLSQNYQDDSFNRYDAANLLHISEKTLQRRMNKYFNLPFNQFLRSFRLERAREMLQDGKSITEVTFAVGFSSTSYFGQCFKHEFGYSPSMLVRAA